MDLLDANSERIVLVAQHYPSSTCARGLEPLHIWLRDEALIATYIFRDIPHSLDNIALVVPYSTASIGPHHRCHRCAGQTLGNIVLLDRIVDHAERVVVGLQDALDLARSMRGTDIVAGNDQRAAVDHLAPEQRGDLIVVALDSGERQHALEFDDVDEVVLDPQRVDALDDLPAGVTELPDHVVAFHLLDRSDGGGQ